jgi:ferrous iron transport protein B
MSIKSNLKIALLGNPNSGKSSLFNHLTGLNQKIGNFPGVTVDKKTGSSKINGSMTAEVIDLPGTYSLYPKSLDEQIVFDFLNDPKDALYPDLLLVIVDVSNLKRNLLLFTQIRDLGFPVILALNMLDVAAKAGLKIDIEELKRDLNVPVVSINGRTGQGIDVLKAVIACPIHNAPQSFLDSYSFAPEVVSGIKTGLKINNDYRALQLAHQYKNAASLNSEQKGFIEGLNKQYNFESNPLQSKETIKRYELINHVILKGVVDSNASKNDKLSNRIDKVLTHKIFGYLIFFSILFILFQAVFAWAAVPMDLIDTGVTSLNNFLQSYLPKGPLAGLLTDGLISGLGGVLIFIPQIAILFTFISILEESGYMSRVMFMMDKIMRKFGLNGRSVVPLISGVACAVPAIMATRNIDSWKDRLITIFVTPLMSCSARIPVYTILIALVVPQTYIFGLFNLQGLALMALYLLGFLAAIFSALVMKLIIKSKERSYFIMEFPSYKIPRWKNVGITIIENVKTFVFQAGKVIIAISIILWVLASYGPGDSMENAREKVMAEGKLVHWSEQDLENKIASSKLEASYAGHFGHSIEPVIKPLGFDWKIGIALLTSFAAREVFIGTMSTIYSIGNGSADEATIKGRMREEKNPATGLPLYTPALAFSLLIFYAFAMQCMSTLAIVYRETKSWKWPVLQFFYMTGLAYVSSLFVYQILK